jgi:hypothetical protein
VEYHPGVPPRIGEILVGEGVCSQDSVRDALRNQVIFGGRLGTNLLEVRAIREEELARTLGAQHRLPSLHGDLRLDSAAVRLLTPEIADRHDAVPYALADRRLALLVVDPGDLGMLDEVAFATGKLVHPIVVPQARVWSLLRDAYGIDRHLRGIDVQFGSLAAARDGVAEGAAPRLTRPDLAGGPDLMEEGAFEALYAGSAPLRPACRSPEAAPEPLDEIIELTDLLEPEPGSEPEPAPPPALGSEVLAGMSGAGHAPPARLARPPAARPPQPEPSALGFDEAVRFLEGVDDRSSIARTVLRFARSRFQRAVLLTVHRGAAHGWAGLGERLGADAVRRIHVPLGAPGIVDTVVRARAHFLGPIPKTEANVRLLRALGGGVPGNAFLVPILAMGRVVNVFYADNGRGGMVDAGGVGELLILATRIARSYEALLERIR